MLLRFISRPSSFRLLTPLSSKSGSHSSNPNLILPRFFSNNNNNNTRDHSAFNSWKLSQENDGTGDSAFGQEVETLAGLTDDGGAVQGQGDSWLKDSSGEVLEEMEGSFESKKVDGDYWQTAEGFKPWSFVVEEEKDDLFDHGEAKEEALAMGGESSVDSDRNNELLEKEEQALSAVVKGPNRAFGDLIAASGITDEMLDSLIALKDLEGVEGLPPLSEIEDIRYEKNTRKSTRAEIERQKQEEVAKARVRQVDEKGRAYGTGRRKCSIARVWVQPGDGKFTINDKQFDVYFPMLDHRAALLRPFSETKTLGLWDVTCTVKGGGMSGQVGAIQLGISRALQNWEPGLRPQLREVGFLTRDPRMVERKKPGKAKARKSYQWVKR